MKLGQSENTHAIPSRLMDSQFSAEMHFTSATHVLNNPKNSTENQNTQIDAFATHAKFHPLVIHFRTAAYQPINLLKTRKNKRSPPCAARLRLPLQRDSLKTA